MATALGAERPESLCFTIALAGLSGWVDATGFLHWRGLFVSFMSGNTTTLGVLIGAARWSGAAMPACVLAAFLVGVVCGAALGEARPRWSRPLVLLVVAALLTGALLAPRGVRAVPSILLALGMGVQSAAVHRVGPTAVAVTYVTGTLVTLGRSMAKALFGRAAWRDAVPFALIWLGLLAGAVGGAVVGLRSETSAIVAAAGFAAGLAILSFGLPGRLFPEPIAAPPAGPQDV